jgi:hypothetical protein
MLFPFDVEGEKAEMKAALGWWKVGPNSWFVAVILPTQSLLQRWRGIGDGGHTWPFQTSSKSLPGYQQHWRGLSILGPLECADHWKTISPNFQQKLTAIPFECRRRGDCCSLSM